MKHTLKIITIGAGVLLAPFAAKAETITGAGTAFGCTTISQFERILLANKYDEALAGKMMEQAVATKDCKHFPVGAKVTVVPTPDNGKFVRVRGPISARGFWVFKGRVK